MSVTQTAASAVHGWEVPDDLPDFVPMSSAITIETDRLVEIDPDHENNGIEIDLCVALPMPEGTSSGLEICDEVLKRLAPFYVQSMVYDSSTGQIVDASQNKSAYGAAGAAANKLKQMDGCMRGNLANCPCSCLFLTKHLTSFVVADTGAEQQGEDSAALEATKDFNSQVLAAALATSSQAYDDPDQQQSGEAGDAGAANDGGGAGAAIGGAVGAVIVVVLVASFVVRRKRVERQPRGGGDATARVERSFSVDVEQPKANPMVAQAEEGGAPAQVV